MTKPPLSEETNTYVGPNPYANLSDVVWADKTRKHRIECDFCERANCTRPVTKEFYRVRQTAKARQWDLDNPVVGSVI